MEGGGNPSLFTLGFHVAVPPSRSNAPPGNSMCQISALNSLGIPGDEYCTYSHCEYPKAKIEFRITFQESSAAATTTRQFVLQELREEGSVNTLFVMLIFSICVVYHSPFLAEHNLGRRIR